MSSSHCLGLTTAWKITRILLTKMMGRMRRMRRIHGSRGWVPSLENLWGLWPAPDQWHAWEWMQWCSLSYIISFWNLSAGGQRVTRNDRMASGSTRTIMRLKVGKIPAFGFWGSSMQKILQRMNFRFWQVELEEFRSTLCRTVQLYFCFKTKIYKEKIPHKRQQHLSVGSFVSNELNSHVTLHLARGLLALCCSLQSKVKDS